MSKKDFSTDTNDVFSSFFSTPTVDTVDSEVKEEKKKAQAKPQKEVKNSKKIIKDETKKEEVVVTQIKDQEPIVVKTVETPNITLDKAPKTHSKDSRYNFFVNNELSEYVSNITWIKRQKNVATYMNSLIKKDFMEFLNLPADTSNEILSQKWEEYKKENNL